MIKKIAFSLLFAVAALTASAEVTFDETSTLEEVLAKGKSEDKLIFVDIHATWCPPCRMMERDVFSREDIGEFMNANFVNAKYNIDEKIGGAIAKEYNISSIPTYLVFTADGKLINRITGALSGEEFVSRMYRVLSSPK